MPELRFGPFVLDAANALFLREGRRIELEPKALDLLQLLASRPGQLVTKDEILDIVWGRRFVSESVVKTVISDLRAALEDDARSPRWIETVTRRGYRFLVASGSDGTPPAALPPPPGGLSAAAPLATAFAAAPPSPAGLAATGTAPPTEPPAGGLHGRTKALATLRDALANAVGGRRQVLFLAGEAGIGKSALIEHFTSAVLPAGTALALGQCVEHYGSGEPYMPVLEALGMLCRRDDGADTVTLLRQVAPTWLAQLPWLQDEADRATLRAELAGSTPERMLREFGEWVDRWTSRRPLVLVLEDLHWSDHATVQLIGYLARRRGPAALLLLGTFRPADVLLDEHPFGGIRQELRMHRLCAEIDLEALAEIDVGALVAARLGSEGAEDFVRALHRHTEGLPLYVAHVLDEMIAAGSLRRGDGPSQGGWIFPPPEAFGVPDTITGVIDKQAARLPGEQQRVLEMASVAGVEFMHLALAGPLQRDPEAVRDALDAMAAQRHWLRSTGVVALAGGRLGMRYSFRHALVRRAFYQRLGTAQRMSWHRQIAAALVEAHGAAADEAAAELAMHFERGGEPLAAARQLALAGARALARGAAPEVLRAVRHGLELLAAHAAAKPAPGTDAGAPTEPSQTAVELELRVLEGVALTRQRVISRPEVAEAFDRACALADHAGPGAARARALFGRWRVSFARAEIGHAHRQAQHMLDRAGDTDPTLAAAARSALGSTLAMMGELAQARQQLTDVLAGSEADRATGMTGMTGIFVQDPGVVARGYLALVLWWAGEPAPARRLAAEAVSRATELRHPLSQLIALNLAGLVHFYAGEPQRTLALIDELYEVIRRHGLPTAPGPFSWLHGHVAAALGRADEGFAEMREAERSCLANGMRTGLSGFYRHYAEASRDAGRADDAIAAIEQGIHFAEASGERFLLGPLLRLKAELALARDDTAGAAAALAAALEVVRRQGAAFHEIGVRVTAARLPGSHTELADEGHARLATLLQPFEGEEAPVLQAARALLRH